MPISPGFREQGCPKRRDAHITAAAPLLKRKGNWAELTFAQTFETVTGDREKNWPIPDRRSPSGDPKSPCES